MDTNELIKELRRDEGVRSKVYLDSKGIETIGVGRNLVDRGLSDDEIDYLLMNDITQSTEDAQALFSTFHHLSDDRQRILVNMAFNLGRTRLSKFVKFITAVNTLDFDTAAIEMLDSKWARQVGIRAARLSEMMKKG